VIILNTFFTTLLIGVSLSMDAFSLSLIYGMQGISNRSKILLSVIVGMYHFFMPLIGLFLGNIITSFLFVNINILVAIIFLFIGIEMFFSNFKDRDEKLLISISGFLIFGFAVSIDSFTTGIGLNVINSNYLQVSIIFCLISGMFTFCGLILGNKLGKIFGKISTLIGGIILIILSFYYFFK